MNRRTRLNEAADAERRARRVDALLQTNEATYGAWVAARTEAEETLAMLAENVRSWEIAERLVAERVDRLNA